jgi:hypothetical protein
MGGGTGCLALIVDEAEMMQVAKDNTLNCTRVTMRVLLNPKTTNKRPATDKKTLAVKHTDLVQVLPQPGR